MLREIKADCRVRKDEEQDGQGRSSAEAEQMLKPNLDSKGRGRNRWRGSETVLEAEEASASP